uniref:Uncharacterized protein n=1 Tax=Rhizophora mucronata TaxID=61149 RepID=A0A2P2NE83_RHIMU
MHWFDCSSSLTGNYCLLW